MKYLGTSVPVIMFHGLCRNLPHYAVFSGGRTCILHVDHFYSLIEWITKRYQVITSKNIESALSSQKCDRPPIMLTFDDGLASVIDLALPILRKFKISAVVFVTTDWIESGHPPAIFLLERVVCENLPVLLSIKVYGKEFNLQINSLKDTPDSFMRLWNYLFSIQFPPLDLTFNDVSINGNSWEWEETAEDRHFWFPASWGELRDAAQSGVIEIGSHMVSHTPLTWLNYKQKMLQLENSRELLSHMIGLPITSCSYPHGFSDSETISLAGKVYELGFTNKAGKVQTNTIGLSAPRFHVPGEAPELIQDYLQLGITISSAKRRFLSILNQTKKHFFR